MNEHFKKALLEFGRVVLLAVVAYLLTEGAIENLVILLGGQLEPAMKIVVSGLITSLLKSIDKYLHESGVAEKGITRF